MPTIKQCCKRHFKKVHRAKSHTEQSAESGLDHNKVFEVEVLVDDVPKKYRNRSQPKKRLNKMRHILCLNQWEKYSDYENV